MRALPVPLENRRLLGYLRATRTLNEFEWRLDPIVHFTLFSFLSLIGRAAMHRICNAARWVQLLHWAL